MYYLQSRYYNPTVGRFINSDVYASTGQGLLGCDMFAYCNNNPARYFDPAGEAFVGVGAQFDITIGGYECGIEVILYWADTICNGGDPVVAVYIYEGATVNLDELLINPEYLCVVEQLSLSVLTNAGKDYDTLALIELQATLFSMDVSASVVGIWGYDNFESTGSYAGGFTSYTGTSNHVKVTWSYCNTCWSIAVGGTTAVKPHISFGQTFYTEIYSSLERREVAAK